MVPVTAITMMNAVIASPAQRWSHKILFRNMSCPSGMGVPFDVNETCRKVTGGLASAHGARKTSSACGDRFGAMFAWGPDGGQCVLGASAAWARQAWQACAASGCAAGAKGLMLRCGRMEDWKKSASQTG